MPAKTMEKMMREGGEVRVRWKKGFFNTSLVQNDIIKKHTYIHMLYSKLFNKVVLTWSN